MRKMPEQQYELMLIDSSNPIVRRQSRDYILPDLPHLKAKEWKDDIRKRIFRRKNTKDS